MPNNYYLTYDELMKEINKLIEKKIKLTTLKINMDQSLIKISNLRLGKKIENLIGSSITLAMSLTTGITTYNLFSNENVYGGLAFGAALVAGTITIKSLIRTDEYELKDKNNSFFPWLQWLSNHNNSLNSWVINQFTKNEIKQIRTKEILENKQKEFSENSQEIFYNILTQHQKQQLYRKDCVEYILNLLDKYSLQTIFLNIIYNTTEYLDEITDQKTIAQINHLSSSHIKPMLLEFERIKPVSRQLFEVNNNIWVINDKYNYNHYIKKHNDENDIKYFDFLTNLSTKLGNDFIEIEKKIKKIQTKINNREELKNTLNYDNTERPILRNFGNYWDDKINQLKNEYQNLLNQKNIIATKLKNLNNWPLVYNDLLSIDEKDAAINDYDKLSSIFDELLLNYDIKALSLGLFEGKIEILDDSKSNFYKVQFINNSANKVWEDYQVRKDNIQIDYQNNYIQELEQILTNNHSK